MNLNKKMRYIFLNFILIIFTFEALADDASDWLKIEIDTILQSYTNENISNEKRFLLIE